MIPKLLIGTVMLLLVGCGDSFTKIPVVNARGIVVDDSAVVQTTTQRQVLETPQRDADGGPKPEIVKSKEELDKMLQELWGAQSNAIKSEILWKEYGEKRIEVTGAVKMIKSISHEGECYYTLFLEQADPIQLEYGGDTEVVWVGVFPESDKSTLANFEIGSFAALRGRLVLLPKRSGDSFIRAVLNDCEIVANYASQRPN